MSGTLKCSTLKISSKRDNCICEGNLCRKFVARSSSPWNLCEGNLCEPLVRFVQMDVKKWSYCVLHRHNEAVYQGATPVECLHGLLECIHFENIDGESLQRFFRLPKLGEILKIDEVKQCAFDGFLEDVRAFKRSYSAFRDFNSDHLNDYYSEIIVKKWLCG